MLKQIFLWQIFFSQVIFANNLTILHTNDWQSRLMGYGPNSKYLFDSPDSTIGGVSRLHSLITRLRQTQDQDKTLLIDAGDFTMGTLFHTVALETGAELQLMALMQYDAVCLGNHEFDFGPDGLSRMIRAAQKEVGTLPPILASNIEFSDNNPKDQDLKRLMEEGVLKRTIVLERGGRRIGFFGLMGYDASEVAPNKTPVTFSDPIEAAKKYTTFLREQEKVDLVILLSHSGVVQNSEGEWDGEEVDLLKAVPGIDLIIGGHTHTPLHDPIFVDKRPIVQAGSDTGFLGQLTYNLDSNKHEYKLHPITSDLPKTKVVDTLLVDLISRINRLVLNPLGFSFHEPILSIEDQLSHHPYSSPELGQLVAYSYRKSAAAQIGFTPNGTLRDSLYPGTQLVSDLFRIVPLGEGVHSTEPGYPLIRVYFHPNEVKMLIEVMLLAYKTKNESYLPYFSGLKIEYNAYRLPLDQVSHVWLETEGNLQELDLTNTSELYSFAVTSYAGQFLFIIDDVSKGLFNVTPKNQFGQPIEDLANAVVFVGGEDKEELKAWQAFVNVLGNWNGARAGGAALKLPKIIQESALNETRSVNPLELFHQATWIQYSVLYLPVIIVLLCFLVLRFLRRRSN